jgi:hypothetical protein
MARPKTPLMTRFYSYFSYGAPDECWNWFGPKHGFGHGRIFVTETRKFLWAHRLSYEVHVGPIPKGLFILHNCDNPSCVNPRHLRPGTIQDNIRDMDERGRRNCKGREPKLSADDVREIRRLRNSGLYLKDIGSKFGVSEAQVSLVARGKSRGNII